VGINDELERDSRKLEGSFFRGANAPLLAELRRTSDAEPQLDRLREVVRIKDEAFVRRLQTLGVRPELAVAVTLVPLVFVAWGDGELDDRERKAILDAARQRGVAAERIAERLLENALAEKPDPRMFKVWTTYVSRLWGCFTADERWQMRSNLLDSAREVAEAAGGFLGLTSKISAGERRVLDEIAAILD
jgi:tellurite resistance protein